MKHSPFIGITTRLDLSNRRFYLGRDYSEALKNFGATPVMIPLIPKKDFIKNLSASLDGVLLPGNDSDVDPIFYGEEPHKNLGSVIPEKDSTDFLMLEEAENLNLPILAICYGMQALNVRRGGTLYQDIGSQIENSYKHEQGRPLERNSHTIKIDENTELARLITKSGVDNLNQIRVNSHHHQAIKKIGNNLVQNAFAADGVIEGIEDDRKNKFVLGVQWHPELSWKTDELSKSIFKHFVGKCAEKASEKRK